MVLSSITADATRRLSSLSSERSSEVQDSIVAPLPQRTQKYKRLARVEQSHVKSLVRSCLEDPSAVDAVRYLAGCSIRQSIVTSIPLILADFFALWFLLYGATTITERMLGLPNGFVTRDSALLASILLLPIAHLAGLYPAMGLIPAVEFRQLVRSAAIALCIFAVIGSLQHPDFWPYFCVASLCTILLATPLLPASRFFARAVARRCSWWGAPAIVLADSASLGKELFLRLKSSQERGIRPLAVALHSDSYWTEERLLTDMGIPCFPVQAISHNAVKGQATWLLIATHFPADYADSWPVEHEVDAAIRAIPNHVVLLSSGGFDCGIWDRTQSIGSSSGILLSAQRHCVSALMLKRAIDVLVSLLTCLFASPLLIAIALAIRLTSPGPVIYGQKRIGRGGRPFTAWKFRSMVQNAEATLQNYLNSDPQLRREWEETHKLQKDPRITWIGRLIRTTSLDELPQIWNILCGDMSIVGPRPIVDSPTYDATYIHDYPHEFSVYASVRPGLTGMWQIASRNSGTYELRIYWDLYYVRNWSLWLDLYITLRTVRTVLMLEGAA